MNIYYYKYLKYKNKYLKLKLQDGGLGECKLLEEKDPDKIVQIKKEAKTFLENKKTELTYYVMSCKSHPNLINEFNWDNYKKCQPIVIKKIINQKREEIVNGLITFIFSKFKICEDKCNFTPSGSTGIEATLDSDYDLTINGHFQISQIIRIFNSTFESVFKKPSSVIFDTNLYGYSFILPQNIVKHDIWEPLLIGSKHYGINISEKKSFDQDKWSLLRLLSLNKVKFIEIKSNSIQKYFKGNDINMMETSKKQSSYICHMQKFEKSMRKLHANKNKDKINNYKKELISKLSEMNYYGDETYFTQGAFLHVVGLMYLNEDLDKNNDSDKVKIMENYKILKEYHLIHSMIENMAYFIESITKKDIIYSIKYFSRFLEACYIFNTLYKQDDKYKTIIEKLTILTKNIKSYIRNRTDEEIIINAKNFGITGSHTALEIRTTIITELHELINGINKINIFDKETYIKVLLDLLSRYINDDNTFIRISKNKNNTYDLFIRKKSRRNKEVKSN
jgi:hypothetical protein